MMVALAKSVNIRRNVSQICDPYLSCSSARILDSFIWSQTETKLETGQESGSVCLHKPNHAQTGLKSGLVHD